MVCFTALRKSIKESYTIKRKVYVFVCLFSLSVEKLTNRLTQTRKKMATIVELIFVEQ